MVHNKNTHAARRDTEYNVAGVPTTFFDGGYGVDVGVYEDVGEQVDWYSGTIVQCGNRVAPNIDVSLSATWLGSATMNIKVSVQNNETSNYNGRIRVYVTELVSSMGWKDNWNHLYRFPFLDYAFNKDISIEAKTTWRDSTIWNGSTHNDGHGHTFGSITPDNVMVIAAVFNATSHPGYADPPHGNPFNAYYVDETAAARVNQAPNTPTGPLPANGAPHVDIDADLSWTGGDPNSQDTVTYDVYFGTDTPPPLVISGQSNTTYDPETMIFDTTYFWQIVAWDNHDISTAGPVWSFITDDNCRDVYNPNQEDYDGDGVGDSCDTCNDIPPAITPIGDTVLVSFSDSFIYYPTIVDPDNAVHTITYLEYPHWCSVQNDSVVGTAPDTTFLEKLTVTAQDSCSADTLSFMVLTYLPGDANGDRGISASDVVYLINYLFIAGPAPVPIEAGDANCDAKISASDVVYLINYLFISGPPPGC